jgi:hypothetical protein
MHVKTNVKAGAIAINHNEAPVRAAARGLKVQTGVKAGLHFMARLSKSSPKLS